MTDVQAAVWEPVANMRWAFPAYEASTHGEVRSVTRKVGNRTLKGVVLTPQPNNKGYLLIKMTDAGGVPHTVSLHTVVLSTHAGACPPGKEACHLDDDQLNNHWAPGFTEDEIRANGGNLMWGTHEKNIWQRTQNSPPAPREPVALRYCVLCGNVFTTPGKRCHDCVVDLGERAARLMRSGYTLEEAAAALDYPHAEGLMRLAVKYGGYTPSPQARPSFAARIAVTLRHLWPRRSR